MRSQRSWQSSTVSPGWFLFVFLVSTWAFSELLHGWHSMTFHHNDNAAWHRLETFSFQGR